MLKLTKTQAEFAIENNGTHLDPADYTAASKVFICTTMFQDVCS